jgi:Cu/Zn superoxide dismutase
MRDLLLLLLLSGLPAHPALAAHDVVTVKLDAQNNSGQTGTATLTPEGDKTRVAIELSNGPKGVAQPAHIHLGTCDKLDKAPKWKLEAVKDGKSVTTVPASLDTILKDKTAINVHKSANEIQVYVSCGNITAAK